MTKYPAYQKFTRFEIIVFCILLVLSLGVHGLFIIDGLGEQDAGRRVRDAVFWNMTGDASLTDFRVTPLYVHLLKKCLDWGVPILSLPFFMNWFNVIIGTFTIIPMYLLWRRIIGLKAAAAGCLLFTFCPAFWLANIYGYPHLASFGLFLTALLMFDMALDISGWRFLWAYIFAIICMMFACSFKADIFLCGGAFFGIMIVKRKVRMKFFLFACTIVLVSVLACIIYVHTVAPTISSELSKVSTFNKQFPFTLNTIIDFGSYFIMLTVQGPVLSVLTAAAIVYCLFIKKDFQRLVLLVFLWCIPSVIFWGLHFGNAARHMMMAFSSLPFVLSALLFSDLFKTQRSVILLVIILILNYFSLSVNDSLITPSTRIFESKIEIQKRVSNLHEKGMIFALLDESKKVFIGSWTNPYTLFEVLSNARDIQANNYPSDIKVITKQGKEQIVSWRYVQQEQALKEAEVFHRNGWAVWSNQYDFEF